MKLKVELLAEDPNVIRQISDRMVMEMPVKREKITDPGTINEDREIVLVGGKTIRAHVDPVISMPLELFE